MTRAGRTIRTPTFALTTGKLYYLVKGAGMAYASVGSHVMISGPLHARLVQPLAPAAGFRWVEHNLSAYQGQRAHVEFTAGDGEFAVAQVVQAAKAPGLPGRPDGALLRLVSGAGSAGELAAGYQRLLLGVVGRLEKDELRPSAGAAGQARLANWLVRHGTLFGLDRGAKARRFSEVLRLFVADQARTSAKIRHESRLAVALLDGSAEDEHVFIRGSHKALGPVAPRRFLEALAGPERLAVARGSGRLELARQLTDPGKDPFVARVLVNRVWHHLFGRGIVASVDNFGVMGEPPTHPELLDYLADHFVKGGWSVKKLIRELVLTNAYRMASKRGGPADRADPENRLLHRARIRRLEGEAIRDALLAVSGRLDLKMYGPAVPVHLTAFQDGRGRPGSGPLDGDGRRSIYLGVRRNFLSPLMLAFDTPSPFSTVGRRTVSNVPAQSLILMNGPFVHQQAGLWARRALARGGSAAGRVAGMYLDAFGRPPTEAERAACLDFLARQAKLSKVEPDAPAVWADLAHALFNAKEFIFLN
jgi:hypothetical protein